MGSGGKEDGPPGKEWEGRQAGPGAH